MKHKITLLTCLMFVLASAAVAWADEDWNVANGNYGGTGNWSGGSVPNNEQAFVRNGGVVTIDSAEPNIVSLRIGGPEGGSASSGTLYVQGSASLTMGTTGGGTDGNFVIGQAYGGTVHQSSGVITTPALLMSASGTATNSYYDLSGGSLIVDYSLPGGVDATVLNLGGNAGANGGTARFVQSGGYVSLKNSANINIGNGTGSWSEFTMTNGAIIQPGNAQLNIGLNGSRGSFTFGGGSLALPYKFQVGTYGTGLFVQTGGTIASGSSGVSAAQVAIGLAQSAGTTGLLPTYGEYDLHGGQLQCSDKVRIGFGWNPTAGRAVGVMNMDGGTFLATTTVAYNALCIGYNSGEGTFNLTGGSTRVRGVTLAGAYGSYTSDYINYAYGPSPKGVLNIKDGGSLYSYDRVTVGANGQGILTISNGGTLTITDTAESGNGNTGFRIAGGYADGNADGTVTISGSTSCINVAGDLEVSLKGGTGRFNLNGGSVNITAPRKWVAIGSGDGGTPVATVGIFDMTDGYFKVSYPSPSGANDVQMPVFVGFRGTSATGGSYQTEGTLRITGGTFIAPSIHMLERCDPNYANKAYLKVGANASVTLNGTDANSGLQIFNGGTSTVEMELASASKNALLNVTGGTVNLGTALATLVVTDTSTNGYRPGQGDKFTLITATGGSMGGSF
ncbi:MAG: hypothetical protein ABSH10_08300, partial [Phycisphaerae bacterium]